jgi:hypothetical protein
MLVVTVITDKSEIYLKNVIIMPIIPLNKSA